MVKFIQCRNCIGKNGKVGKPGYISRIVKATDGVTDVEVFDECECHKKWRESSELEYKAKKAGLNPKWQDFNIDKDYVGTKSVKNITRINNYMFTFLNPPDDTTKRAIESACLYIYGPNGTQKTTVANWIGYEMLRNGKSVKYILMNDLIKMLQKAERDEDIQVMLDKILESDCLIIDEALSRDKVTIYKSGYQLAFLDSYLRNRIQGKNKGIIFISNTKIDDINTDVFGESIKDLVSRNVRLCNGELLFEDNFIENKSSIDIGGLF